MTDQKAPEPLEQKLSQPTTPTAQQIEEELVTAKHAELDARTAESVEKKYQEIAKLMKDDGNGEPGTGEERLIKAMLLYTARVETGLVECLLSSAESVGQLHERIDELNALVTTLEEKVEELEGLAHTVDDHESKLWDLDGLESQVSNLQDDAEALEKRVADLEEAGEDEAG